MHLVIGVRDLARTLTSAWQQAVVLGSTITWQEFADSVTTPDAGSLRAGVAFSRSHDLLSVLDVWGSVVPPERIHLVTVPPAGGPPPVLLERFARAVGIPATAWRTDIRARNDSLGAAEVETLRRLNLRLAGQLPAAPYRFVVQHGIRKRWQVEGSRRLLVPEADLTWVAERSEALIAVLGERGYDVIGDLNDLRPSTATSAAGRLDEVTDAELLGATEAALFSLALAHGQLFRGFRRRFRQEVGRRPTWGEIASSNGRAAGFRFRRQVLAVAEGRPLVAAAVRRVARLSVPRRGSRRASRP